MKKDDYTEYFQQGEGTCEFNDFWCLQSEGLPTFNLFAGNGASDGERWIEDLEGKRVEFAQWKDVGFPITDASSALLVGGKEGNQDKIGSTASISVLGVRPTFGRAPPSVIPVARRMAIKWILDLNPTLHSRMEQR